MDIHTQRIIGLFVAILILELLTGCASHERTKIIIRDFGKLIEGRPDVMGDCPDGQVPKFYDNRMLCDDDGIAGCDPGDAKRQAELPAREPKRRIICLGRDRRSSGDNERKR